MKLIRFSFEDKANNWRLEEMHFNDLTLLVGASGVGKTRILEAIYALNGIAKGHSINGNTWFVEFEINAGENYIWQGEFEIVPHPFPNIIREKLSHNDEVIAERKVDSVYFEGKKIVNLNREQSLINLLKEEEKVKKINSAFLKMEMTDNSYRVKGPTNINIQTASSLINEFNTIAKIQDSNLDVQGKLFLCYKNDKKIFNRIKGRFIDIFPQVKDIRFDMIKFGTGENSYFNENPLIHISEEGVNQWILQPRISSGMLRTLFQISELYLMPEGTIFLIDEFENSLGVNCITDLVDDILYSDRQLQFIITSHHPYIINNISYNNWKLVTRNGGVVSAKDISEFNFEKSKHDAFFQLINLEQYQTGSTLV